MSDKTSIEWTRGDDGSPGASWNPIRMKWLASTKAGHYCLRISPGCDHCYASRLQPRMFAGEPYAAADHNQLAIARALVEAGTIYLDEKTLEQPLHWRRPRRIFVCSMTDLFGEWVPQPWIDAILGIAAMCPQHTFMVLTKRPNVAAPSLKFLTVARTLYTDRLVGRLPELRPALDRFVAEGRVCWPLPNVWLGVTIESDRYAWRAKVLQEIPAAVRWVSAEPLLGPLPNITFNNREPRRCGACADCCDREPRRCVAWDEPGIDWLVVGGESGGPLDRRLISRSDRSLGWVRDLRDRAHGAGTPFFFKQWGGRTPKEQGRLLDGREHNAYPEPRVAVPV